MNKINFIVFIHYHYHNNDKNRFELKIFFSRNMHLNGTEKIKF